MDTAIPGGRQPQEAAHFSRQSPRQWWFAVDGQAQGPVAEPELREMCAGGKLGASDMVWAEGMAEWVEVSSLPHLTKPRPPPVPPRTAQRGAPGAGQSARRPPYPEPPPRVLSAREEFISPSALRFLRQTAVVAAIGIAAAVLLTVMNRMQIGGVIPGLLVVVPMFYLAKHVVRNETFGRKQAVIICGFLLSFLTLMVLLFIAMALGL